VKRIISPSYQYNQKTVIREWVLNFISTKNIHSFLDIGAGFPQTALHFKNAVATYLAVERDRGKAKVLKDLGIGVIAHSFPCSIAGSYDLVLTAHSIPENGTQYPFFFKKAYELVSPNGYLVIITFKGVCDAMSQIRAELRNTEVLPFEQNKFNQLMSVLKMLGRPNIDTITSMETSSNLDDIVKTVYVSLNDREEKHINKIRAIIKSKFTTIDGYHLPHDHNIIVIQKQQLQLG